MKVLIITYYWPPAGGSGVQRWLKFVKYLQDFGVTPVIYCPENAKYASLDKTLLNEMKLHPKRFVHFSLFGKRDKGYNPEPKQKEE